MKQFIKKHKYGLIFILLTITAITFRIILFNFQSRDFIKFLNPWLNYFRNNGGLKAIARYPGDYNAPYVLILALLSYLPFKNIYLIKIISIIFDFLLALASGYLGYYLSKNKKIGLLTYALVLFIPQFIMNGAMWGQCDSIYTFFIIISLIYFLKEKYLLSFIFFGISFAFKLQSVFILPLYIILYFSQKKFPFWYFFLIPLVEVILCIPNIIMGMPFINCFAMYLKQIYQYKKYLVRNYPNIYQIINFNYNILNKLGVLFVGILCLCLLIYILKKHIEWNEEKIINLGLLIILLVTYFLPCMHERYIFVGEVLGIIYYIVYRKNLGIVLMINLNALVSYILYLLNWPIKSTNIYLLMATIYGLLLISFTYKTLKIINSKQSK